MIETGRIVHFPRGPIVSLRELTQNLMQMNFWLLGWPMSLVFVPFFRRTPATWLLASVPMVVFAWYAVHGVPTVAAIGPVYYAEAIVPLVILSASGLDRIVGLTRERFGDTTPSRILVGWVLTSALTTLLIFVPLQLASLRLMVEVTRAPYALVEHHRLDDAVVFVRNLPAFHVRPGAWVYYHRNPQPDLSDRVLFVRDLGPEKNRVLMDYLPRRSPYLMGMRGTELVLMPLAR
jgi:hypothetical protein